MENNPVQLAVFLTELVVIEDKYTLMSKPKRRNKTINMAKMNK